MRLATPITVLSTMLLAACQASVIEEKLAPPSFTGTHTQVDLAQSTMTFLGKSNIVNHPGSFQKFTATLTVDANEPANLEKAKLEAVIDMASIQSDSEKLTGHLLKEDFFAAEQYPEATFVSTSIAKKDGNEYEITGDLTVKGITKPATWIATVTDTSFQAHYELPRQDFTIGNDSYGNKLLDLFVPVDVMLVLK